MTDTEVVEKKKRPFIAPGWHKDLTNEQYHGSFGTSSSSLKKLVKQTPAHLAYSQAHPMGSTDAMALGTAVHTLILEPEKAKSEILVMPDINRRTNAGREEYENFMRFADGKTVLTPDQFEAATAMAESVLTDPYASILLEDTVRESSVYWWYKCMDADDDTDYKEMLKVRPDAISRAHSVIMDVKTCRDASLTTFSRDIHSMNYHLSAAMYLEGVNQNQELLDELGHLAYSNFIFICVENTAPYLCAVYELSHDYLALGRQIYQQTLRTLHRARAEDWPGYPPAIRLIDPPNWAKYGHVV